MKSYYEMTKEEKRRYQRRVIERTMRVALKWLKEAHWQEYEKLLSAAYEETLKKMREEELKKDTQQNSK